MFALYAALSMGYAHMHEWGSSLHSVMVTPAIFGGLTVAFALGLARPQPGAASPLPWRPFSLASLLSFIVSIAALAYATLDLKNPDVDFFPSAHHNSRL